MSLRPFFHISVAMGLNVDVFTRKRDEVASMTPAINQPSSLTPADLQVRPTFIIYVF